MPIAFCLTSPDFLGPAHDFILSWLERLVDEIPPANRVSWMPKAQLLFHPLRFTRMYMGKTVLWFT